MIETAKPFEKLYQRGVALPWNLNGPTPFVRELNELGRIHGLVLDAGCGTGENALYLAGCNYRVVAFDGAPTAIRKAQAKAVAQGLHVDFRVADARELGGFRERFDTVIDSGLFHVLGRRADRLRYAACLRRVGRQGGSVYLLAFRAGKGARARCAGVLRKGLQRLFTGFGTHGVSERELRETFREGWKIESLDKLVEDNQPFYLAHIRRD